MSAESVLNKKALDDIRALQDRSGSDLLSKIINMYLDKVPELIAEITQSAEQENLEQLWTSAHSLKSSSASVGATRVYEVCVQLEGKGRAGESSGIQQLVASLQHEASIANRELETYLASES